MGADPLVMGAGFFLVSSLLLNTLEKKGMFVVAAQRAYVIGNRQAADTSIQTMRQRNAL